MHGRHDEDNEYITVSMFCQQCDFESEPFECINTEDERLNLTCPIEACVNYGGRMLPRLYRDVPVEQLGPKILTLDDKWVEFIMDELKREDIEVGTRRFSELVRDRDILKIIWRIVRRWRISEYIDWDT